MSSELETRLADELRRLPGPSRAATERARRSALAGLPPPARARMWRPALVATAAAVALLALGAGALARIGAIHVGARPQRVAAPASAQLELPAGARGILLVSGGRLWLTTRGGTRIERLPVSAAELSPHARYVAAGIGRALVVMAPDGRRAWSAPVRGTVEAVAWAPSGLRLAYVVRTAGGMQLRTIEGDGDHDRLLDAAVRPVRPSWRADSLALAYVARGGRAVVYDLAHRSRRLVGTDLCPGPIDAVTFAPGGARLALAGPRAVYLDGGGGEAAHCLDPGAVRIRGVAWSGRQVVAAVDPPAGTADVRPGLETLAVTPDGRLIAYGGVDAGARVRALAPARGGRLAVVLARAGGSELVLARTPPLRVSYADRDLKVDAVLLRSPGRGAVGALAVR